MKQKLLFEDDEKMAFEGYIVLSIFLYSKYYIVSG